MIDQYAEICGISEKEIHTWFEEDIHELAAATGMSYEETCKELKTNYDGYHFTENAIGIVQPVQPAEYLRQPALRQLLV